MNPVRSKTPRVSADAQAHRTSNGVKKSDIGDIIEIVIILAILVAGFFHTAYGLFDQRSVSGSHNRYYETREDF